MDVVQWWTVITGLGLFLSLANFFFARRAAEAARKAAAEPAIGKIARGNLRREFFRIAELGLWFSLGVLLWLEGVDVDFNRTVTILFIATSLVMVNSFLDNRDNKALLKGMANVSDR